MNTFPSPDTAPKQIVRLASTANLALSGLLTVDSIASAAGDPILAKDQTTPSQNGIYIASASAWSRAVWANVMQDMPAGHSIRVSEGTANSGTEWINTNSGVIIPGTTGVTYKRLDGSWNDWAPMYEASALLAASAAAGTWVLRYDGSTPIISTAAQNGGSAFFMLDPAQYAVTGKTIQVRLAAYVLTNSTAPGITFTFGLYPISSSSAHVQTLGAASTTVAIATPAANSRTAGWSNAITMPAAGAYVLACATSGANAAAAQIIGCALQMRAI